MALLEVLKFPDPRLRKMSKAIDTVTEDLVQLSKDMLETMYDFKGIGLAAPQVGHLNRLLVIDTRQKGDDNRYKLEDLTELEQLVEQPLVVFNPVIVSKEGTTTYDEGCLSIPSFYETVERYDTVEIEGLNQKGKKIKVKTDGLLSICIQHEIDHLDGKLFIDRLSVIKSGRIKKQIKKYGYPDRKDSDNDDEESEGEI